VDFPRKKYERACRLRILFAGEVWLGATGLSLVTALQKLDGTAIETVSTDDLFPKKAGPLGRALTRGLDFPLRLRLEKEIQGRVKAFRPEVFLTCKGWALSEGLVRRIRRKGISTVNFYPDLCPLSHGSRHRRCVGAYDLVISTKQAHLRLWNTRYGYKNRVAFVPHGYDPDIHYRPTRPVSYLRDVGLVATWREGYEALVVDTAARLQHFNKTISVCGGGWSSLKGRLPGNVLIYPPVQGDQYVEFLRESRVCIAPLSPEFDIAGFRHPGDQDTTRTYELAAANCFFIHQRTPYVGQVFDEESEVPMFATADELADKILYFLAHPLAMDARAVAAHRRAVPNYSTSSRAIQIYDLILEILK
jgi:spore maturation protein CgeB